MIANNLNSNIISSIFYVIDFHRNNIIENNGIWVNEAYLRYHMKNLDMHLEQVYLRIDLLIVTYY